MKFVRPLGLVLLLIGNSVPAFADQPDETIIVRGERPVTPSTSLWFEEAYDDYQALGPKFAKGLVIWNHPIDWTGLGPDVPPIKAIEGMAAQGWDVIRMQRNPREPEGAQWERLRDGMMEALAEQVAKAQARGYKRVIIAGQGFGGGIAVESALTVKGLYGVIAFAPSIGLARQPRTAGVVPSDFFVGINEKWTVERLKTIQATRLFVLFPQKDEQMFGHDRGASSRKILSERGDMPFALIDETQPVVGNTGADSRAFEPFTTCLDYFFEPAQTPHNGEFHCGIDETQAALAKMGVKPGAGGGQGWYGTSTRGQETYVEQLADGRVIYGWGHGPLGKVKPGVKTFPATVDDDSFSFALTDELMVHGTRTADEVRLTIDQPDKTRAAVVMHRIGPVKAANN